MAAAQLDSIHSARPFMKTVPPVVCRCICEESPRTLVRGYADRPEGESGRGNQRVGETRVRGRAADAPAFALRETFVLYLDDSTRSRTIILFVFGVPPETTRG